MSLTLPSDAIELRNKNLACYISPSLGGGVVAMSMTRKGIVHNILQPTFPVAITEFDPRQFSLTHIAPIGGRIRGNQFKWEGRPITLEPNFANEGIFRNGIVWQRAWAGKKDSRYAATLVYKHIKKPGWPFDFTLRAVFDLEEDNLTISYELTNEGRAGTMPAGLGTEMRFPKLPGTMITAGISQIWQMDADNVPTMPAEVPFNLNLKEGIDVEGLDARRWFSGWTGKAIVDHIKSQASITIKATDLGFLGFSTQPGNPYFRVMALSHVPGMLDIKGCDEDETGLRALGAGESMTASVKIDVDMGL